MRQSAARLEDQLVYSKNSESFSLYFTPHAGIRRTTPQYPLPPSSAQHRFADAFPAAHTRTTYLDGGARLPARGLASEVKCGAVVYPVGGRAACDV